MSEHVVPVPPTEDGDSFEQEKLRSGAGFLPPAAELFVPGADVPGIEDSIGWQHDEGMRSWTA